MNLPALIGYGAGIYALDSGYQRPGLAAVHLLVQNGRVAIIDTGTRHGLPRILAALAALGLGPEAVEWVIVTHVHLDHAGAAGALLAICPHARLLAHPRGARHMVDPARLVEGAMAVYGETRFRDLYGEVVAAPEQRVEQAADGHSVNFHGRRLTFLDTPGHARHHFCIHDGGSGGVFTGDAFGLSYREFDVAGRAFIFPTTTPVQFEPDAMHTSIERIMAQDPAAAFLTHFGRVRELPRLAADLHQLIDAYVDLARRAPGGGALRLGGLMAGLETLLTERLRRHGCTLDDAQQRALLAADVELNAQGLSIWLDREESSTARRGTPG